MSVINKYVNIPFKWYLQMNIHNRNSGLCNITYSQAKIINITLKSCNYNKKTTISYN